MDFLNTNVDYQLLLNTIKDEIGKNKLKLQTLVDAEKTNTFWNIGNFIQQYLIQHSQTDNYKEQLLSQLSFNLNIGKRSLYLALQFYILYPDIFDIHNNITWSHFKILLTIRTRTSPCAKMDTDYYLIYIYIYIYIIYIYIYIHK